MTLKSRASLTKSETESFDNFVKQCRKQGLLPADQGLQSGDCDFGFKDEATLLYDVLDCLIKCNVKPLTRI